MTDLNLTKLRKIAEAATPGPWNLHTLRTDETHDIRGSIDDEANIVIYAECEDADAAHVATFDPPTVLALIDEVEQLRAVAEAKVERVRTALANHPRCERHPDDDPIMCGWKSAVLDVQAALDGDPNE